jgi:hypothetical protein
VILKELTELLEAVKAGPRDAAWMTNAPTAKMEKLASANLPEPVQRALAARLSNGEINDLLRALASLKD